MEPNIVQVLQTVLVLPALAIVGLITAGIIKTVLKFTERKAEIQAQASGAGNDSLRTEMEALRQEVARLRDTSTQYDISIQHSLEDMQRRLEFLENKRSASTPAAHIEESADQKVAARGS
jgi:TolA-binding protein